VALELQPHRPHEVEHLLHDRVGHLRSLMMSASSAWVSFRFRNLAAQQPSHHHRCRQRFLPLRVATAAAISPDGGEPIAEPLPLSSCSTRVRSSKNIVAPVISPSLRNARARSV